MRRLSVLLLLPLAFATCIDDPTAVEEEGAPPLSEEEIEFLGLTSLFRSLEAEENVEDSTDVPVAIGTLSPSRHIGPAAAPVIIDETVQTTVPCGETGVMEVTARLQADADDETGIGSVVFTLVLEPELCQESTDGSDFTLFGDPNITTVIAASSEGDGVLDIEGSMTGGIGVLTGGRVADCPLDVAFAGTESEADGMVLDVEGQVCGRPVATVLRKNSNEGV
jgi:hypothetical protein